MISVSPLLVGLAFLLVGSSVRWKTGRRLAELYPAVRPASGTKWLNGRVVFGSGPRMHWVKMAVDHAHLHIAVIGSLRRQAELSVPLQEVTAEPGSFLMILDPEVVRLTFARDRTQSMMVWPSEYRQLAAASGGRLPDPSADH